MLDFLGKSVKKIFGTKQDRDIAYYDPMVEEINEAYEKLQGLTHDELRGKTITFRAQIKERLSELDGEILRLKKEAEDEPSFEIKEELYEDVDRLIEERDEELEEVLRDILPEAFAVVKETARRFVENETMVVTATEHDRQLASDRKKKDYISIDGDKATYQTKWMAAGGPIEWNMVHYDVQLIGGMVLHDGKIAEMATGEGKTLVATLPAYLNGLSGLGVHVVTVNDYLARRDSEWIGPIMEFLLLTIGCIDNYQPHSEERRKAYRLDITYGTNNEFGFDYLRDNMVRSTDEMVQRKHHFTMIDEVDSVLIDDARTPLIISGPVPKGDEEQEYNALKPRVERLIAAQRKLATTYLADAKRLFAEGEVGVQEGEAGMALLRAHRAYPKYRPLIKFLSQDGVKVLLQKTENHYMQEQSKHMHIVDEPLYFSIDEKTRNVDLLDKGADFLSRGGDDENMFIMPDLATEMMKLDSDEEMEEKEIEEAKSKLVQDFSIKSRRLHSVSQLLKAYAMFERDQEYVVLDGEVKIVDESTGRIMDGRRYSDGLHQALEAKENVKVGDITQTYATVTLQNYFRMYHKLCGMTGTAETEAGEFWEIYKLDVVVIPTNRPIVRFDREDMVYKTEREKFNAVIDDVVNLTDAGRPVLVGTTSVDISEKLSRMLNMRSLDHNVLNAKQHQREADIVAEAGLPGKVTIATNMAGRGTDIKLSDEVKNAGGLAIIGTERHDSRRVDRQLRGRSGRQGDPGSSQFYVSLEDNLMRLFRSERIAKLMDKMGHQDGEVIQHSMVTKSIERAQKKLEENNFGIRKRLLEYDDVMNIQRGAIYKKRWNALSGERLEVDLNTMFLTITESLVATYRNSEDYTLFRQESLRILGLDPKEFMSEDDFLSGSVNDLIDLYQEKFFNKYAHRNESLRELIMPTIQRVQDETPGKYKRVALPFTDGTHHLNVAADIDGAIESGGRSIISDIQKTITLAIIDEEWKEHLRNMDELKDATQSASFEQKDPLVVYKMEAYELFEQLIFRINERVSSFLAKGMIVLPQDQGLSEARQKKQSLNKLKTNRLPETEDQRRTRQAAVSAGKQNREPEKVETLVRSKKKVGRNDPCPCGSGKKYKQCHGKK